MRSLFFLVSFFVAASAFSQVRLGPELGYGRVSFSKNDVSGADYYRYTFPLRNGHIGVTASVPFANRFFLQPSLFLIGKGGRLKEGSGFNGHISQSDIELYYAELPVDIMYSVAQLGKLKLLAGAGAYVAAGLWGREEGYSSGTDSLGMPGIYQGVRKVKFTNDLSKVNDQIRRVHPIDAGGNVLAQAEWKNLFLNASYSYGLTKTIAPDYKNRVFAVSAGYFFGVSKSKVKDSTAK